MMWNLLGRGAPILIRDALSMRYTERYIQYCMHYTVKVPAPGFVWLLKDFSPRALYLPVKLGQFWSSEDLLVS